MATAETSEAPIWMAPHVTPSALHSVSFMQSSAVAAAVAKSLVVVLAAATVLVPHWRVSAHPVLSVVELHDPPFAALPTVTVAAPVPVAALAAHVPTLPPAGAGTIETPVAEQVWHAPATMAAASVSPTQSAHVAWHTQSLATSAAYLIALVLSPTSASL